MASTPAARAVFHTVVTNSPQPLDVPHFYMRPNSVSLWASGLAGSVPCVADTRLSCCELVDSIDLLKINYAGESALPTRAKAFFATDFAVQTLLPFIKKRNWTVEWTNNRLAVYAFGQLVPPAELRYFAADVRQLGAIVATASQAYVAHLDQRIADAAARLQV